MSKLTKNQKIAYAKVEAGKAYKLSEAAALLKEITFTKFDASVDIDVRLGVDPRKANQMVRGVVTLPHGTGKTVRVLVLCTPEKEAEAQAAGADYVGLDEYVDKIKAGWTDVDVIICTPNVMGKVGALGRILGPRGLMPNPKTGTVTMEVGKAVQEVKAGKIDFKVDKFGIIHTTVGKVSFSADQIVDNAKEVLNMILKLKPAAAKGFFYNRLRRDQICDFFADLPAFGIYDTMRNGKILSFLCRQVILIMGILRSKYRSVKSLNLRYHLRNNRSCFCRSQCSVNKIILHINDNQ